MSESRPGKSPQTAVHAGSQLLLKLLAVCLLGLTACRAEPAALTIAAAASLRNVFEALGPRYTQQTGQAVVFSFAASGQLLAQIRQGAPYDVFASAGADEMQQLARQHLLKGEPLIFAANRLVLTRAGRSQACDWPSVRTHKLALGNPDSVPAGRYAREVLQHLDQWPLPQPILTENVRQAVDYLRQGAVDYAIVYASDARVFDLAICQTFPARLHRPIRLPIAVLATSPVERHAASWLRFLTTPEARTLLQQHGFQLP